MDRPSPRKRNYKIWGRRNILPPQKKNMTIFVKENEMSISIDLEPPLTPPPPPPSHRRSYAPDLIQSFDKMRRLEQTTLVNWIDESKIRYH